MYKIIFTIIFFSLSIFINVETIVASDNLVSLTPTSDEDWRTSIIAKSDIILKDDNGDHIGIIEKGSKVTLHTIEKGQGVVHLFGKELYVDLSKFRHDNLVNPKKNISFYEMEYMLNLFSKLYPEFTQLETIGRSTEGRLLYALKVGTGELELLMDASMHGREHMTTNVLLEMIDEYIKAYVEGTEFGGYDVKKLLDQVSIWFVPMMNPDGVTLVQSEVSLSQHHIVLNDGSANFNRWKANSRGIDLNRNFDGGWMSSKTSKNPAFKDYKGERPFSEPESMALRDFVAKHNFQSYITYHSSGSILYYYHHQTGEQLKRDLALAKKISNVTGYRVMPPTGGTGSGASADWFIMTYKRPGITIEIAPHIKESFVPLKYWDGIWKKNKYVGLVAIKEILSREK